MKTTNEHIVSVAAGLWVTSGRSRVADRSLTVLLREAIDELRVDAEPTEDMVSALRDIVTLMRRHDNGRVPSTIMLRSVVDGVCAEYSATPSDVVLDVDYKTGVAVLEVAMPPSEQLEPIERLVSQRRLFAYVLADNSLVVLRATRGVVDETDYVCDRLDATKG